MPGRVSNKRAGTSGVYQVRGVGGSSSGTVNGAWADAASGGADAETATTPVVATTAAMTHRQTACIVQR
jgi:hypothetical protein